MTQVADLMRRGLIAFQPEARLAEVARVLLNYRIHSLIVAEDGGSPLDLISTSDILAEMAASGSVWQAPA